MGKKKNSIKEQLMDGKRVLMYSYNPPTKTFLVYVVTGWFSAEWVKPNAYWRKYLEKIVEKESGEAGITEKEMHANASMAMATKITGGKWR